MVDGLGTDMLMKRVECLVGCRPDSRIVINERGADYVGNLVLVTLVLCVGRTLTVKPSTQRKRQEERTNVHDVRKY